MADSASATRVSHAAAGILSHKALAAATATAATVPWNSSSTTATMPRCPSDDRVDGSSKAKSSGRQSRSVAHKSSNQPRDITRVYCVRPAAWL